jgi:hypothetical protein
LNNSGLDDNQKRYMAWYFISLNTSTIIAPKTRLMGGSSKTYDTKNHSMPHESVSVKTRFLENHHELNREFIDKMFAIIGLADDFNNETLKKYIIYLTSQLAREKTERGLFCEECIRNDNGLTECLMLFVKNHRKKYPGTQIENVFYEYTQTLQVHHRDLNSQNGDPENQVTLCPLYHGMIHTHENKKDYSSERSKAKIKGSVGHLKSHRDMSNRGLKKK